MLEVSYEENDDIKIVRFHGELRINDIDKLKKDYEIFKDEFKYLLFDFSELYMIDSSGLGYVVSCFKHTKSIDGDLKIIGLKDQVKLTFEITRVDSIIDIVENEITAIENFIQMEKDYEGNTTDRIEITA